MAGELRLSAFRYSQTPDDDFVIGSPLTAAAQASKYLVFQVNTAVGYGSNPHIRCEWIPDVSSWRLRFSHDGLQVNDFALTNTDNIFEGINTFNGSVAFNESVNFSQQVQFLVTPTVPTMPTLDSSLHIANTQHVKQVISEVTVNNAAHTDVADDNTLNALVYPTWVPWSEFDPNGYFGHSVSSTKLSFNPATGNLASTVFSGSGAGLTNIPAGQLTGTFSNVSFYLGNTQVALNRPQEEMSLEGITSITGSTLSLGTTLATTVNLGTGPVSNTTNIDGTTLNLGTDKSTAINVGTAASTQTVNIGTGAGITTINIGGAGDTVNIAGTLQNINTTNLEVTDKTITLNNSGAVASGESAGIEIEENAVITAYVKVGNSRTAWDFKAPATSGTLRVIPSSSAITTTLQSTASSNIIVTLPSETCTLDKVGHNQPVSTINDATTLGQNLVKFTNPSAIRFIQINADNTVSALDAASFRTAIGAGTSSTVGTVTSVSGTGSVSGITLGGTVTSSGSLTLGGTLAVTPANFASQAANTFLAAPDEDKGTPTFRTISASDIPTLNQNTTGSSGSCTGNSATASKLATARTIQATGDVSWAVSFDGSGDVSAGAAISSTTVTGKLLTGYVVGSNTILSASDSILGAFQKVQGQLNAKVSSGSLSSVTFNNSGTGDVSGSIYNTSSALTVSYNTIGAAAVDHTHVTFNNSINVVGDIVATGDITAFGTVSDIRLKKDIKEIENAVEKVKQLRGITFKFNDVAHDIAGLDTDSEQVGIIAQDLEAILPQLTPQAPFNTHTTDYMMVKYDRIVALLIQAIKEQQVEIDALKSAK